MDSNVEIVLNPLEDKNFIYNCVKDNDSFISFVSQNGKSVVWNRFQRIYYQNNETLFVKCDYCQNILKHTKNSGTCGLLKHKCQQYINYCHSEEGINLQINYGVIESNNSCDANNKSFINKVSEQTFRREIDDSFPMNDRNFYLNLVKTEDKSLSFIPQKGKSEVWSRFDRIYHNNCETLYVKCKYCDDIQKNTQRGGTSGLVKHKCEPFLDYCRSVVEFDPQNSDQFDENEVKSTDDSNEFENNENFNYESNRKIINNFKNPFNELLVTETDESFPINDRTFYVNLVKSEDKSLTFIRQKGKSEVWNRFERIYYNNCETLYVKCKYCDDIQKNTQRGGTSGLVKHKCQPFLEYCKTEEALNHNHNDNEEKDLLMDKNFVRNLVHLRDTKISFTSQNGKSEVWNRFERICYENVETVFVKCMNCNNILKHTKNGGTCGLLYHICESDDNYEPKQESMSKPKLKVMDEKLLIKKLKQENKTLKVIVEKCMKMIDKCLCVNKYNSIERKEINVLVNDYNKWLFEFKDYDLSEEDKNNESYYQSINETKNRAMSESESDGDPDYKPHSPKKQKIFKPNSMRNNFKMFLNKSLKQKVTNAIKKKYQKNVKSDQTLKKDESLTCEWPGCERVFKYNQKLKEHRDRHLEIKNYVCDWPGCEDSFINKTQLNIHICKYHTNDKPFKCDQCSYSSSYKAQLLEHKNSHTGLKPHVCDWPGCEFKTIFDSSLRAHKRRHSDVKPYKCSWPSCEWSFRQSHHLKVHLLKHTGEKPVLCQFKPCDRRFTSRQAMRAHFEKIHNNVLRDLLEVKHNSDAVPVLI